MHSKARNPWIRCTSDSSVLVLLACMCTCAAAIENQEAVTVAGSVHWLEWGKWSHVETLQFCLYTRTRLCSTTVRTDCTGRDTELLEFKKPCQNVTPEELSPHWLEWSDWKSVDRGNNCLFERNRNCSTHVVDHCELFELDSRNIEIRPFQQSCEDIPQWSPWNPWFCYNTEQGECTAFRERSCLNKTNTKIPKSNCLNATSYETGFCSTDKCKGPYWLPWTDWECIRNHNTHVCFMRHLRNCSTGHPDDCDGFKSEVKLCDPSICSAPFWHEWTDWHCGYDKKPCFQSRSRNCSTGYEDDCHGLKSEVKLCDGVACIDGPHWSVWSNFECDYFQGLCFKKRFRTCSTNRTNDCHGLKSDVHPCDGTICKAAFYQEWGAWTEECINNTCYKHRTRTCSTGKTGDCRGKSTETVHCSKICTAMVTTATTVSTVAPATQATTAQTLKTTASKTKPTTPLKITATIISTSVVPTTTKPTPSIISTSTNQMPDTLAPTYTPLATATTTSASTTINTTPKSKTPTASITITAYTTASSTPGPTTPTATASKNPTSTTSPPTTNAAVTSAAVSTTKNIPHVPMTPTKTIMITSAASTATSTTVNPKPTKFTTLVSTNQPTVTQSPQTTLATTIPSASPSSKPTAVTTIALTTYVPTKPEPTPATTTIPIVTTSAPTATTVNTSTTAHSTKTITATSTTHSLATLTPTTTTLATTVDASTSAPTTTTSSKAVTSNWSQWFYGPCSVTCRTGTRQAFRHCSSGHDEDCAGSFMKSEACNSGVLCPGDGGWGSWQAWSACSVTCGDGTRTRLRACDNPAPTYVGRDCHGNNHTTDICKDKECPIDGGWGSWQTWSACSVTCGNGTRTRLRICDSPAPTHDGDSCHGDGSDMDTCREADCANWSPWFYSVCSVTYGTGTRQGFRHCSSGHVEDCTGSPFKMETCSGPTTASNTITTTITAPSLPVISTISSNRIRNKTTISATVKETSSTSTYTPTLVTTTPISATVTSTTTPITHQSDRGVSCLGCHNTPTNLTGCTIVNCNSQTEWCFVEVIGDVVNSGCRAKLLCQAKKAVEKKRDFLIGQPMSHDASRVRAVKKRDYPIGQFLSRDAPACSTCCNPTSQCLCNSRVVSCEFNNFYVIPYILKSKCT